MFEFNGIFFLRRNADKIGKQKNKKDKKEKNLSIEKTLKNNSPIECNTNSTSLPAAECVKENKEQNKKSTQNFSS